MLHVALSCGISLNLVPSLAVAANTEMEDPTPIVEEEIKEETSKENVNLGANETTNTETDSTISQGGNTQEPITPVPPETPSTPEKPENPGEEEDPGKEPEQPEEEVKPEAPKDPVEEIKPEEVTKPEETIKPEEMKPVVDSNKPTSVLPSEKVDVNKPQETKPTISYEKNTWYHPTDLLAKGYAGNLKKAMKLDDFMTSNLNDFLGNGNPFMVGQCTWFAWARFHQVYGFDSGARGNGKTNAIEIVRAHSDKFELSSTPAAGATFSMERNTLMPQYGHVGFVEAFDGEYLWISEGNVMFNGKGGNIWVHKVRWEDYKNAYPDIVFAIPKKGVCDLEETSSKDESVKAKPVEMKRVTRKKKMSRAMAHRTEKMEK